MLKYSALIFIQKPNFRRNFFYQILLDTTVLPDTGGSTEPSKRIIDSTKDRILLFPTETLPCVSTSLSHLVVFLLRTYMDIEGSTIELITAFNFHQWRSGPFAVNTEILKRYASRGVPLDRHVVQNEQDCGGFTG